MNFKPFAGPDRSNRRRKSVSAPVAVETCEQRSLLTTPVILTPAAESVVDTARPEITWQPVDGAVSYDVWIADADSRTLVLLQNNVPDAQFVPNIDLNQARLRVWVRANLEAGPAPDWSSPHHFRVQVVPTLTGPVNPALPGSPQKINSHSPVVRWTAAPGSSSFELWFENRLTGDYETFTIQNLTPALDAQGNPRLNAQGNVIRQEIRSFQFPSELPMGSYQLWIRTTDAAGRVSRWSQSHSFEVATNVNILRPTAPTMQSAPLLEWAPVKGATHYDLWVEGEGKSQLYRWGGLTTTSFQIPRPLGEGTYRFWVRAILRTPGQPNVNGIWSNAATFSKATRPIITGPIGTDGFLPGIPTVTAIRPTLEWTRIDSAARYDVWIDRGFGPAGFIQATASTNSYTVTQDLPAGRYTAWVRALGPTGIATPWSRAFEFYATGGSPIILSPLNNSVVGSEPTITWTPVDGAASYEIWIAWVGVDFDYYVLGDIPEASHTVDTVLPSGSYRVWVRAIMPNGSAQNWSTAVLMTVVENEQRTPSEIILTGLLIPENRDWLQQLDQRGPAMPPEEQLADADAGQPANPASSREQDLPSPSSSHVDTIPVAAPAPTVPGSPIQPELADALQQLAEGCVRSEWWMVETPADSPVPTN